MADNIFDVQPTIDNPPVDERLIQLIESGRYELTDDRFFELIQEVPAYLACKCFQERIAIWRDAVGNPLHDSATQKQAKKNLQKIGAVLAFEGQGAPNRPDIGLFHRYKTMEKIIDQFLREHMADKPKQREEAFKINFPMHGKFAEIGGHRNRSASEIAICIMKNDKERYHISERTLRNIIKRFSTMEDDQYIQRVLELYIVHGKDNETERIKDIERALAQLKKANIDFQKNKIQEFLKKYPRT